MRTSWNVAAVSCALLLLSGCAGVPTTSTIATSSVQGTAVQGKVHGGRQPISGASVYLYAAGTGGYGTASVLLIGPVTTASDGTFTIPSTYSLPQLDFAGVHLRAGRQSGLGNQHGRRVAGGFGCVQCALVFHVRHGE